MRNTTSIQPVLELFELSVMLSVNEYYEYLELLKRSVILVVKAYGFFSSEKTCIKRSVSELTVCYEHAVGVLVVLFSAADVPPSDVGSSGSANTLSIASRSSLLSSLSERSSATPLGAI